MEIPQENMTISPSATDFKYTCPMCKKDVMPILIGGRWYKPECQCQIALKTKEKFEELVREDMQKRVNNFFRLNPRLANKTLRNFIQRDGTSSIYDTAKGFIENIDNNLLSGKGIIFLGGCGVGKSHLSAAIANAALSSGHTVVYEVVPTLLSSIRKTYGDDSLKEWEILESLELCDLLVLDDIGSEKSTEWTESILYSIVNKRYEMNKSIILSTNCTLEALKTKVGVRTIDRILEMCKVVKSTANSYRKEMAFKNLKGENKNV